MVVPLFLLFQRNSINPAYQHLLRRNLSLAKRTRSTTASPELWYGSLPERCDVCFIKRLSPLYNIYILSCSGRAQSCRKNPLNRSSGYVGSSRRILQRALISVDARCTRIYIKIQKDVPPSSDATPATASYGSELVSRPRAFQLGPSRRTLVVQSLARCGSRCRRRKYAAAGSTSAARGPRPGSDRRRAELVARR